MMNKEACQKYYHRYLELRDRMNLGVSNVGWEGESASGFIDPNDFDKLDEARERLRQCLEYLSCDDLIEISEDDDISAEVRRVLIRRKMRK